jgi:hypothetical protein
MQCKQKGCEAPATVDVFWPGQRTQQCAEHARAVVHLGTAMGFHVETRPLEPDAEIGGDHGG